MDQNNSRSLISSPEAYLAAKGADLDTRIANIRLPEGTEEAIARGKARKLVRDQVLGLFRVGSVIKEFLNWNENVDKDIREAKKNVLLSNYFAYTEETGRAVLNLKSLVSSAYGSTLFNKIVQISDNSPPDEELIAHLSAALTYISQSDFEALFETHRYALSQIEHLTAQALAILSDHRTWPSMQLSGYTATGAIVSSDWLSSFAVAYSQSKGIVDSAMQSRVSYSISELITRRLIEAQIRRENFAACVVTLIGKNLIPYLAQR